MHIHTHFLLSNSTLLRAIYICSCSKLTEPCRKESIKRRAWSSRRTARPSGNETMACAFTPLMPNELVPPAAIRGSAGSAAVPRDSLEGTDVSVLQEFWRVSQGLV